MNDEYQAECSDPTYRILYRQIESLKIRLHEANKENERLKAENERLLISLQAIREMNEKREKAAPNAPRVKINADTAFPGEDDSPGQMHGDGKAAILTALQSSINDCNDIVNRILKEKPGKPEDKKEGGH